MTMEFKRWKHKKGLRNHPLYRKWCSMKYRCSNKNVLNYKNYGGRGILVCSEWLLFENFINDMYISYQKHIQKYGKHNTQIERINNNLGYSKNNCEWATRIKQNNNTRKNTFIEFNNLKLSMSEWARQLNADRTTIYYRVFLAKWPLEKALTKIGRL